MKLYVAFLTIYTGAPTLEASSAEKVLLGAYVAGDYGAVDAAVDIIVVATGTEVSLAIETAKAVTADGGLKHVRVISMPCCELFDKQPLEYRLSIFPDNIPVMSLEAASVYGWNKYAHNVVGINTFGMSAPAGKVYEAFGFTVPELSNRVKETIAAYKSMCIGDNTPSLMRYLKQSYVVPAGH